MNSFCYKCFCLLRIIYVVFQYYHVDNTVYIPEVVKCVLQKQFIDELRRAISGHHGVSRQLTEGAAVTCVRLCKASTYINQKDRLNVLFSLVQTVIQDLKVNYPISFKF